MAGLTPFVALALFCSASEVRAAGRDDIDGDGILNAGDPDIDNDGIPNGSDRNVDGGISRSGPKRGRFVGDFLNNDSVAEKDIDSDGISDDSTGEK
ncbi:MAG: hypothetical protein CFE26_19385, partial [Verrucomicrobiales bacterium VVV1]